MNFTPPFQDSDRAVSPVIGVILMVAITVILAAVIGSFVLELGGSVNSAPQATFDFDTEESSGEIDSLTIVHNGGDSIDASRLQVTGGVNDSNPYEFTSSGSGFSAGESVSAGDELEINASNVGVTGSEGDTVRVVFTSEDGSSSTILARFELPSNGAGTS